MAWGLESGLDVAKGGLMRVYIGSYNDASPSSPGLTVCHFNTRNGELAALARVATPNATFLALDRRSDRLYLTNDTRDLFPGDGGGVSAFDISRPDGVPLQIGAMVKTPLVPCHLTLDNRRGRLLVAAYLGSAIVMHPVDATGAIGPASASVTHVGSGPDAIRQSDPHPHAVVFDREGERLLVPDLGIDRVAVYEVGVHPDHLRALDGYVAPPGAGPRHIVFHPSGQWAFLLSELASTITVLTYDQKTGALSDAHALSALPVDFVGTSMASEIQIHPTGRFLYASNRGHDSIATFGFDPRLEDLKLIGHVSTGGANPRHFALSDDGQWLLVANLSSNQVRAFRIDMETGLPRPTSSILDIDRPACVLFAAEPEYDASQIKELRSGPGR